MTHPCLPIGLTNAERPEGDRPPLASEPELPTTDTVACPECSAMRSLLRRAAGALTDAAKGGARATEARDAILRFMDPSSLKDA